MLVIGFPAAAFGTNCYLVAPDEGEECLVIDPGVGVLDELAELLGRHRLKPSAVLATHGHVDHVFSVTPVCGAHGVAVRLHPADRYRLADPMSTLGPQLKAMFEQQFGASGWKEPEDVVELTDRERLCVAGLEIDVIHAPGHTEGSVMFGLPSVPAGLAPDRSLTGTLISGDVLFAGSIGRTDLLGGSTAAMTRTLREKVLPLPDGLLVLPGHGEATTIGRERATNPYLQGL